MRVGCRYTHTRCHPPGPRMTADRRKTDRGLPRMNYRGNRGLARMNADTATATTTTTAAADHADRTGQAESAGAQGPMIFWACEGEPRAPVLAPEPGLASLVWQGSLPRAEARL